MQESLDDAHEGKYGNLPKGGSRHAVGHRWVSGSVMFERYLGNYNDWMAHYDGHNDGSMCLSSKEEVKCR